MPKMKDPDFRNWPDDAKAQWNAYTQKMNDINESRKTLADKMLSTPELGQLFGDTGPTEASRIYQICNELKKSHAPLAQKYEQWLSKYALEHKKYNQITFFRRQLRDKYEHPTHGIHVPTSKNVSLYDRVKTDLLIAPHLTIEQLDAYLDRARDFQNELKNLRTKYLMAIERVKENAAAQISELQQLIDAEVVKTQLALDKKQEWYSAQKKILENVNKTIGVLAELDQL